MFRRPPKFEATADDPFKNDKLGHADFIRNLTMFLMNILCSLVSADKIEPC